MAPTSEVSRERIGFAKLERKQRAPGRGGGAHISAQALVRAHPR